jgi:hypothetical protein
MLAGVLHGAPADTLGQGGVALVGAAAGDADNLRERITAVWDADGVHQADATMGVTTDDLLTAVTKAIDVTQTDGGS